MRSLRYFIVVLAVAVLLAGGLINALQPAQPALAQAPAGPFVTFAHNTRVVTSTINYSARQDVKSYDAAEIQATIDMTGVNTTTVKLQHSNDGVNWADSATLLNGVVADGTTFYTNTPIYMRYNRLSIDTTTTNPVTVSVYAVLEPVQ